MISAGSSYAHPDGSSKYGQLVHVQIKAEDPSKLASGRSSGVLTSVAEFCVADGNRVRIVRLENVNGADMVRVMRFCYESFGPAYEWECFKMDAVDFEESTVLVCKRLGVRLEPFPYGLAP